MSEIAFQDPQPKVALALPEWTEDDFLTDVPYKWIYENTPKAPFLRNAALTKADKMAKAAGFKDFAKMWKAYLAEINPPGQLIGDNETFFPNQPIALKCGAYVCDEYGVATTDVYGREVIVCKHSIMPVKRIIDIDTGLQKVELAYAREGETWQKLIVDNTTIAAAMKVTSLAQYGIGVNSENAKDVVRYLGEMLDLNYKALPVQASTSHMGWLRGGGFAPYRDGVSYDGASPEFAKMFSEFSPTGNEDIWMEIALETRRGSSVPARIALAASFAAPLVEKMNALSFFVHLWGTQGCGKTVGLMLAASVWGNPVVGNYAKTFNGTLVSNEQYAAFCGNMPILLDELQIAADRKSFDNIIYMLCEGVSKGRGAKEGGLQRQQRWATSIITTGEMPIVQNNSGGGAAVRVIEVNYGGEPLFADAVRVAGALRENYGFAGRKFIEALNDEATMAALKEVKNQYYRRLSGDIQEKQVLSASLILAADKLADLTIFHDGKALTVDDIRPYLLTKTQADPNWRCYFWLMGYISSNPNRFEQNDNNGELWGIIEGDVAYIIRSVFDRILQTGGFSPQAFLTWAKRNGKIECEDYGKNSGNNRLTKRKRLNGHHVPCVALITDFSQPGMVDPESGLVEVENDDDMPF